MTLDDVLLEPEQRELLMALVEATRRAGPQNRPFRIPPRSHDDVRSGRVKPNVVHPGVEQGALSAVIEDLEVLAYAGLISLREITSDGPWDFYVRPEGYEFYRRAKLKAGQPAERVEATVRQLSSAGNLQRRYPGAYQKWTRAEELLWGSDSQEQLTTIGHLCREAIQEFGTSLCSAHNVTPPDSNPRNTVNRVRAVLKHAGAILGERIQAFLDALLVYWGTVNDLVQRQEHGGQKEGESLTWEDGRRVVFHTLLVMYEVEQALSDGNSGIPNDRTPRGFSP
jgi:hypothetical protein